MPNEIAEDESPREPVRYLVFSASLRKDSLNTQLAPVAQTHNAFTSGGRIENDQLQERFDTNIANFMDLVEAAKHYPCVKRAWVEYLGEHPDPALDRVE